MLPRLFDIFSQVPVSVARVHGGLGVGLALVRILVELHGGEVAAASEGLGRGSCFSLRLPLLAEQAEAPACPAEPPMNEPAPRHPLRVLVVDDNIDAADSLTDLLCALGHTVEVAYDGQSALAQLLERPVDLVLLDIGLPGMDGYEVARRLRHSERAETYLVAVTGYGSAEDKSRAFQAGVDEHMVKPPTLASLEAVLARVVHKVTTPPSTRKFAPRR
jgi:CheY-like chemotaxis protein